MKKRVLFLCKANSCRSQMAEAIVNASMADQWQAFSAGSQPAAQIHPLTLRVLEEAGIHHSGSPKSVDSMQDISFDLVITVCEDAEEECPVWLGKGICLRHGFQDPAQAGDLETFQAVYNTIAREIPSILKKYQ